MYWVFLDNRTECRDYVWHDADCSWSLCWSCLCCVLQVFCCYVFTPQTSIVLGVHFVTQLQVVLKQTLASNFTLAGPQALKQYLTYWFSEVVAFLGRIGIGACSSGSPQMLLLAVNHNLQLAATGAQVALCNCQSQLPGNARSCTGTGCAVGSWHNKQKWGVVDNSTLTSGCNRRKCNCIMACWDEFSCIGCAN